MTKEEILELDADFQLLIDEVLRTNTSGEFTYWHEVWSRRIKPMNSRLMVCGWGSKHGRLESSGCYEDMQRELEKLSTLK